MVDHLQGKIEAVATKSETDKHVLRNAIRNLYFDFEDVTNQIVNDLQALVKHQFSQCYPNSFNCLLLLSHQMAFDAISQTLSISTNPFGSHTQTITPMGRSTNNK